MRGLQTIRFESAALSIERLLVSPGCARLVHSVRTVATNAGYHRHKLVAVHEIDGLAFRESNGIDGVRSGTNDEDSPC